MRLLKHKLARRLLCTGAAAVIFSGHVGGNVTAYAANQDEEIRNDVTKAVVEMENIMKRSYENAKSELSASCAGGYDYELSIESFQDQGLPFSGYDYERFIAAYATIQEYCTENSIDLGDGINQIPFVQMSTSEDVITEYVPISLPKYTVNEDGTYTEDGTFFLTEPANIGVYTVNDNGTYTLTGSEFQDLESRDTKYLNVELSTTSLDDIYAVFGLSRADLQDVENQRFDKLQEVLGQAELSQLTFINTGAARTASDDEVLNTANELSQTAEQKALIQIASTLIGRVPYEWGGKSDKAGFDQSWYTFDLSQRQKGLDCSGYIQWILRTAGMTGWDTLVNTNDFLQSSLLTPVSMQDLQPGDLGLFYPDSNARTNHIGMYLGNGYWIHCSSTAGTVAISNNMKFSIFRRLNILSGKLGSISQLLETIPDATQENVIEVNPAEVEVTSETEPSATETLQTEYEENLSTSIVYSNDELYLMAKVVMKESYGEGYNGWVGVAQVIYNRVLSDKWGNTITDVVSQAKQFTTYKAACRMSDADVDPAVLSVCQKVMAGELTIFDSPNVIAFKRASINDDIWDNWHKYTTLGNHSFYAL